MLRAEISDNDAPLFCLSIYGDANEHQIFFLNRLTIKQFSLSLQSQFKG